MFYDVLNRAVHLWIAESCPLPLLQWTPHFGENFRGLVLGCMGTYDGESRLIFSHFSISTRFPFLCTITKSNTYIIFRQTFFAFFSWNFIIFCNFWINFKRFRADFDENLSEFHGIEKCFTKFRRNLKFWWIRGTGVPKKGEKISAKSLIFLSGG